ncbi:zinc finger, CCHC-type containing protein [Tanacetum coccineum]
MRIERYNQPLSLTVIEKFGLKQLGFTEWIEIHALASKGKSKASDTLLRSLKAKFKWVKTQAGKLGLTPPVELTEVGLTPAERKRKRSSEIIKEGEIVGPIKPAECKASEGSEDQLSAKHQLMIKGLAESIASASNLRDIQVRDIIKKVEDYLKTYSPIEDDIKCLIIIQMDVKTAFLNGELEEEVYMNQPMGFILPGNENKVDLTKEFLSSRFSMKDMGEVDVLLGIRIKHESNGIAISQSHYIEKVLKKFNYSDCTLVSTHLDTCEKLMPNKGMDVSQLEYSRVIGCLIYTMTCTRPDIAFVVGKLSRYTSNPGTQHWQAIQRALKYLKKTMDYRLVNSCYTSVLEGYTDASWMSNTKDNSSTSGWVFLLALAAAGKKAEWLKNLLLEISLWVKPMAPISIHCDSATTLANAYSQMYNGKSRHLGVRHSMIRKLITNRVVSIEFVRSQQNLADHLTKGLAKDLVLKSVEGMRLKSN